MCIVYCVAVTLWRGVGGGMCCALWCKGVFYMCVSGTMTDIGMMCVHVGVTVRRITLL